MSEALDDGEEELTVDSRRAQRIADLPAIYKRNDARMALELVLLDTTDDPWRVFESYGYTRDQALSALAAPAFVALLQQARTDVAEKGLGFKTKVKMLAEEALQDCAEIITDPIASAAVRMDGIKWLGRMAGYEPKDDKAGAAGQGAFAINITFAGSTQPVQVNAVPLTIEGEKL